MVDSQFLVPMIYEFCIYFFCLLIVLVIGKRYRKRKKLVVKHMFYFSLFMSMAILMAAVSRVLRYTEIWNLPSGDKLELLAFTISFIGIGNIFHLAFGLEVFSKHGSKSKVAITIISIYSVLIAGFIVYAIYAGLFVEDLTELIWGLAIGLSIFVYGWTMIAAFRLATKLERGPDKSATIWISISPISIMMVFISILSY